MKLQTRALLLVIGVVVVTVGIASAGVTWRASSTALTRSIDDSAREATSVAGVTSLALHDDNTATVALSNAISQDDDITAARFLAPDGTPLAEPAPAATEDLPDEAGTAALVSVAGTDGLAAHRRGLSLDVIVPVDDPSGRVGYLQLVFDLDEVEAAIRQTVTAAVMLTLAVLAVGIAMAILLTRRVTRPVQAIVNAAAALERGDLDPRTLDTQAMRPDELGTLARQFQEMASEVIERERRLTAQVAALRVEIDEERRSRDVVAITTSDNFKSLESRGREMRERRRSQASPSNEETP